ncbi:MAG: sugar phosphate isomerase/epimerase family protein [Bacillota bacterium]|nr:sugar phosphate isomerase/epimerase family protein [Bacillota bacterium]
MKKGINIWSFPKSLGVIDCIKLAKKAGFDGIELALAEKGELSLESAESEILSFRKEAERVGIEITSVATGLYWSYPLTSGIKEVRQTAMCIVRKQLDIVALLGVDTILVVPGAVGVDFKPGSEVVDYDIAYDRALEALKELAAYAEMKKVSIGIENVWNKFLLSPLEMREFIDKIGSDYLGAYLDVGNTIYTGYPEHWVKILGSRIKKVHLKDYRRKVGSTAGFVDLLSGDVDFPDVIEQLKEIGYSDYLIAEMTPYKNYADQIIYNTSASMDRILERI